MERRPDLVAHAREKLALRAVRGFGVVASAQELGHRDAPIRDVAHEAHEDVALTPLDACEGEFGGKLGSVPRARRDVAPAADARQVEVDRARRLRLGTDDEGRAEGVLAPRRDEARHEVLPERLRPLAPEDALGSSVELDEVSRRVEGDHAVLRRVEHGAAAAVAVVERALGLDQLVHVVRGADNLARPIVCTGAREQVVMPAVVRLAHAKPVHHRRAAGLHGAVEGRAQLRTVIGVCMIAEELRRRDRRRSEQARGVLGEERQVVGSGGLRGVDHRRARLEHVGEPGTRFPQLRTLGPQQRRGLLQVAPRGLRRLQHQHEVDGGVVNGEVVDGEAEFGERAQVGGGWRAEEDDAVLLRRVEHLPFQAQRRVARLEQDHGLGMLRQAVVVEGQRRTYQAEMIRQQRARGQCRQQTAERGTHLAHAQVRPEHDVKRKGRCKGGRREHHSRRYVTGTHRSRGTCRGRRPAP